MAAQVDPQEWRESFDTWLASPVEVVDVERAELLEALGLSR